MSGNISTRMNASYVMYEVKKWLRDPMMAFLLIYPVIMGLVARFGIPYAEEQFKFSLAPYYHIVITTLFLFTSTITGMIIGFSVLDDRDDKILYAIDVSPVSFDFFMLFRFTLSFILTYVSAIITILIADIGDVPLYAMLLVPIASSLYGSFSAMLVNCLAKNKIEGFAMVKATGMLMVIPIASLFFTDMKEFFFGFEPNFWWAKALSVAMQPSFDFNLNFWSYFIPGIGYIILANLLIYRVFKKRVL